MINLVSLALLVIIFFIAISFKSDENKYTFLVFSLICMLSAAIDYGFIAEDYYSYYYLMCALLHLSTIHILSKVANPNNTLIAIQQASKLFIYANLFGWVTYELYISPVAYNVVCASLFLAVLFTSINTRKKDGLGNSAIYSNSGLILSSNPSRSFKVQRNKAEERS